MSETLEMHCNFTPKRQGTILLLGFRVWGVHLMYTLIQLDVVGLRQQAPKRYQTLRRIVTPDCKPKHIKALTQALPALMSTK